MSEIHSVKSKNSHRLQVNPAKRNILSRFIRRTTNSFSKNKKNLEPTNAPTSSIEPKHNYFAKRDNETQNVKIILFFICFNFLNFDYLKLYI